MKKAMISVGLVATLLRMILDDYQNVVLRMQCQADGPQLQSIPGGAK